MTDQAIRGTSRSRLVKSVEDALRRLGTDHIDLLQLHAFDASTPVEETLSTLDRLVTAGKLRYIGASNFAGWELMKSLAVSERHEYPRYVAHQVYYSLAGRDYEWELMPLAANQNVGALVWSPLAWGRLTGKIRRGQPLPEKSRLHDTAAYGPPVDDEKLFDIVEALDGIASRDGQDGTADRHQLACQPTDRFKRHHWRAQRGTVAAKSRCSWLVADEGADRQGWIGPVR